MAEIKEGDILPPDLSGVSIGGVEIPFLPSDQVVSQFEDFFDPVQHDVSDDSELYIEDIDIFDAVSEPIQPEEGKVSDIDTSASLLSILDNFIFNERSVEEEKLLDPSILRGLRHTDAPSCDSGEDDFGAERTDIHLSVGIEVFGSCQLEGVTVAQQVDPADGLPLSARG